MNRRGFLRAVLVGTGAVVASRVEPIRTYFFAPPGGWRGEITPAMIKAIAHPADLGLSMRMVRNYRVKSDEFVARIDCLYGFATVKPNLAIRLTEDGAFTEDGVKLAETAKIDPAVIDRMAKELANEIDRRGMELFIKQAEINRHQSAVIENITWSEVNG